MISIIMPTYNRFKIVQETIEINAQISCEIEYEIIVINDGNDLPFDINYPNVTIKKNHKKGAASARNFGASIAKYPILFFIDDDMWMTTESILAIKKLITDSFLKSNCCVLNWQYPSSLINEMEQQKIGRYLLNANYHTLEGRAKIEINHQIELFKVNSIGSGSFVISKELFTTIGGYNENFIFQGEDIDLSNKLNTSSIGIYLFTPITCFHNQKDRLDITEFIDRDFRGYLSQFNRTKNDIVVEKTNTFKKHIFTALAPLNSILLLLFNWIPNNSIFDKITFRIIGTLSSIAYYKAMKQAKNK